jgi:hypothetical protein
MEVLVDDKDAINKTKTEDLEEARDRAFDIAGNVREKNQKPSPDDRDRGELSDAEPEAEGGAGGNRRR